MKDFQLKNSLCYNFNLSFKSVYFCIYEAYSMSQTYVSTSDAPGIKVKKLETTSKSLDIELSENIKHD